MPRHMCDESLPKTSKKGKQIAFPAVCCGSGPFFVPVLGGYPRTIGPLEQNGAHSEEMLPQVTTKNACHASCL